MAAVLQLDALSVLYTILGASVAMFCFHSLLVTAQSLSVKVSGYEAHLRVAGERTLASQRSYGTSCCHVKYALYVLGRTDPVAPLQALCRFVCSAPCCSERHTALQRPSVLAYLASGCKLSL